MEFDITGLSVAISAILTLAVYSFMYRENSAFRFAEHILIGSFTGHTLVMAIKNIQESGIARISDGNFSYIVPVILGFMLFLKYAKGYEWLQRYPLALMIGVTAGVSARATFQGKILKQITATIASPLNNPTNIVILIVIIAIMSYFTFTVKHTGSFGLVTRSGRILLLFVFGLTIAMDLVSRIGGVTARFEWLMTEAPYITGVGVLLIAIVIVYEQYIKKPL